MLHSALVVHGSTGRFMYVGSDKAIRDTDGVSSTRPSTRKAAWFTEQLFRAYPARPAPVQQAHYFTSDTRLGPFGLRMLAFCLARICRIQVPLSGLFSVITNNDPMRYRRHYNVVRLSGLSHHRVFG